MLLVHDGGIAKLHSLDPCRSRACGKLRAREPELSVESRGNGHLLANSNTSKKPAGSEHVIKMLPSHFLPRAWKATIVDSQDQHPKENHWGPRTRIKLFSWQNRLQATVQSAVRDQLSSRYEKQTKQFYLSRVCWFFISSTVVEICQAPYMVFSSVLAVGAAADMKPLFAGSLETQP